MKPVLSWSETLTKERLMYSSDPESYAGWGFTPLAGSTKPDRSRVRGQTKQCPVLQVGGRTWGWLPHPGEKCELQKPNHTPGWRRCPSDGDHGVPARAPGSWHTFWCQRNPSLWLHGTSEPCSRLQAKAEQTPPSQKPKSEIQHWIPQQCSSGEEVQGYPLKGKHRATAEEDGRMDYKWGVSTCEEALGRRPQKLKEWITQETLNTIQQRREFKEKVNNSRTRAEKALARKTAQRNAKEHHEGQEITGGEVSQGGRTQRNMKELDTITRKLSGTYPHSNKPITDRNGQLISTQEAQLQRWVEHFEDVLNRPPSAEQPQAGRVYFYHSCSSWQLAGSWRKQ